MILIPLAVDTHAMDPSTRDPPTMDPSVSDLPFNDPEAMDPVKAIVNDVVKVNTILSLHMIYFIKNFQVY